MPVVAVVGAQWGDEGKGKVVDLYARHADVVARWSGGANAGHTLVVGDERIVLHLLPSGALHPQATIVLGQGMVIDPDALLAEIDALDARGGFRLDRLVVSERAHVVLPHHVALDRLRERGTSALGTTRRGIGPAYEDRVGRRGVRMGDLLRPERLAARIDAAIAWWRPMLEAAGEPLPDRDAVLERCASWAKRLGPYVGDASHLLAEAIAADRRVLLEGAQGTMLDVDAGSYPYVTSASVGAAGIPTGLGIAPLRPDRIVGVCKAYTTRVGAGPMPTELDEPLGSRLREAGGEYGATTGRPRRCGWLDVPVLRRAVRVNGLDAFAVTKLDVLTGLDPLRLCVAYEWDGQRLEEPPFDDLDRVRPVYETLPGWHEPLGACRRLDELPAAARRYLERIGELVGRPVTLVGVGAERDDVLGTTDPFTSANRASTRRSGDAL
ncbi:MAG: adenylosuccinate synthase [Myxococcota bacterium]|nr:adenylosuccinate synthase [Myxococcota bacterium]